MSPLFRREAVEHQQSRLLGTVHLAQPLPITVLSITAMIMAVSVLIYLVLGEYSRRVRVLGYLAPNQGIVRLMPPELATVAERRVREGQAVEAGEVLYVLSLDRATAVGDTQSAVQLSLRERERSLAATAERQQDLQRQDRSALDRRLAGVQAELRQLQSEMALQRERLALAQAAHQRLQALESQSFVSPAQVQAKGEDVLALRAAVQALERQAVVLQRDEAALRADRDALPTRYRLQRDELDRARAALDQQSAESGARQQIVVRAPQAGLVTAVLGEPGQTVQPGVALASLVPRDSQLQADLYAPSSAIGFLRPALPVALRYDAFPYQRYGHQQGRIVAVSRTPLQATELAALPLPGALSGTVVGTGTEPLYRVTVALDRQAVAVDGREEPLAAGMQLQADVLLERRRLIEWLFEPLLSLARRA